MKKTTGRPGLKYVIGPDGSPLSVANLPCPKTSRWVPSRKAVVVAAVRGGLISMEEVCDRYNLSVEEYLSWQAAEAEHGMRGLQATRLQEFRRTL